MVSAIRESQPCYWCKIDNKPVYAKVEKLFMKVEVCSKICLDKLVSHSKTHIIAVHLNSRQARRDEKKNSAPFYMGR